MNSRSLVLPKNESKDKFVFSIEEVGTEVAQWLRCCATNRKFARSILAGVIGIFH